MTPAMYWAIFEYQGGVCYACGQPSPVPGRRLSVDHNHVTGLIRGLLCSRCNPVLGKLERAFIRFGLGKIVGFTVTKWLAKVAGYMVAEPATKALGHQHFGYVGRVGTKAHRRRIRRDMANGVSHQTAITRGKQ